jgi:hypothetical protein
MSEPQDSPQTWLGRALAIYLLVFVRVARYILWPTLLGSYLAYPPLPFSVVAALGCLIGIPLLCTVVLASGKKFRAATWSERCGLATRAFTRARGDEREPGSTGGS